MLNNKEATKMQLLLQNTKFLSHKGSIHLTKEHLITLHFLHYLINQEPPIYLFLSHIFSTAKQTQNAIFQNQPKNKKTQEK